MIRNKTREIAFMDRAHARDWIITQQLGRRNLTAEQKKYLIGLRFNSEKRQDGGHGNQKSVHQNDGPVDTAERLAAEYKMGKATIERSGEFAKAVDTIAANVGPQARTAILQRDIGMTAKNVELARRPVEAQRAALQEPKAVMITPEPEITPAAHCYAVYGRRSRHPAGLPVQAGRVRGTSAAGSTGRSRALGAHDRSGSPSGL